MHIFVTARAAHAALALAAVLLPCAAAGQSSPVDSRFEEARAFILETMAERGLPSVAVAVAKDGEILWEEGFGWADLENRVRATAHTPYSVASISKPFTATGLMRLVEQGRVEVDEPVNTYLGVGKVRGMAGDARQATVRRVLSHTAGLPLHWQFFYAGEGVDPPTMDETIARYGILVSPPGEHFSYSNLGYGILDHVIERVSGRSYADFMRTEVFLPLGLTRTAVDLPRELRAHAAVRYDGEGRRPVPHYGFDHPGASAIWSSAHDLVRFGMFHLGTDLPDARPILSDESREAMWEIHTPAGASLTYGLGWIVDPDDRGYQKVFHSGGMPGVATQLVLYPEEDVVVVLLFNGRDGSMARILEKVVDAVLPGYAAARPGERLAGEEGDEEASPDLEPLRGTWEGRIHTWRDTIPIRLEVQEDGDVHVAVEGQLETLLNDISFAEGALRGRFAGEVPTRDSGRQRHSVSLSLVERGDTLRGSATALNSMYYALTSYVELVRVR